MKKVILNLGSLLLVLVMTMSMLIGCSKEAAKTVDAGTDVAAATTAEVVQTQLGADAGDDAIEIDYWTFVDLHGKHFEKMLGLWNEANPDRKIKLNVTVMP